MNPSKRVNLQKVSIRNSATTKMKMWRQKKKESKSSQKASPSTHNTKRCNKIRFQQFRVSTVAAAFLCLIDTWYNNSQFEGENKVISRFITIEIQRAQKQRNTREQ